MADWGKISSRGDVEDRRSFAPVAFGGVGIVGVVVMLVFSYMTNGEINVVDVLDKLNNVQIDQQQSISNKDFDGKNSYQEFASTVLGSNNDMWSKVFIKQNKTYHPPKLVLFRSSTNSACGGATSEVGPHYCPNDNTIYLDETFFDELKTRFGAEGGDVAEAYVISHEVGHHAQNELGIMNKIYESSKDNSSEMSVKLELQADCFAGLWVNSIKDMQVLGLGEVHEAMDAASAVGDDRIQKRVAGHVNPETWTHGSSEQRVSWFNSGYEKGILSVCNTF